MKDVAFGVSLTHPQRSAIAELLPQLVDRLQLDVTRQVKIEFTVSLMKAIWWNAGEAIPTTTSGTKRNSLRRIVAAFRQAIQDAHGIAAIPPSKRLYQFYSKDFFYGIEKGIKNTIDYYKAQQLV